MSLALYINVKHWTHPLALPTCIALHRIRGGVQCGEAVDHTLSGWDVHDDLEDTNL